jgi:hypothetical protein
VAMRLTLPSCRRASLVLLAAAATGAGAANPEEGLFDLDDLRVKITETLPYIEVEHAGKPVFLMRHQEPDHTIVAPYDQTARDCPPYCIQPMQLAPGVETDRRARADRLSRARLQGRADPGDRFTHRALGIAGDDPGSDPPPLHAAGSGARATRGDRRAVGIRVWCDSLECPVEFQRREDPGPLLQRTLVRAVPDQYPRLAGARLSADRIKWYRGGMQMWEQLGLTTVNLNRVQSDMRRFHCAFGFGDILDPQ